MPSQLPRRALTNGLIAGAIIVFLILIGLPGGASDQDGLPAWFVWGVFCLIAALMSYSAARARTMSERRAQTLLLSAINGLIVGLIAAVVTVLLMVALNAAQLWELTQTPDSVILANGLKTNITRVQDVLANVTPRTTAVMSGISLDLIKVDPGAPRANPIGGFILMAGLLPIAGVVGGSLSQLIRLLADRRENAAKVRTGPPPDRPWMRWLPIALPLALFIFIVLNSILPTTEGAIGDGYKNLIGANGQLVGLLASFFLIACGLLAVRSSSTEQDHSVFAQRLAWLVAITGVVFIIGYIAPSRDVADLLFSPRSPDLTQALGANGQFTAVTRTFAPVDADSLYNYRRLLIVVLGIVFLITNYVSARNTSPLRRIIANNILLCTLIITPLYLDKYQQSVLLLVGINILLGLGLNIVVGYAGLLDLGYVAFFAIGAYAYAFLSSNQDIRIAGQVVGLKFGGNDQLAQNVATSVVVGLIVAPIVVIIGTRWWRNRAAAAAAAARPTTATTAARSRRPAWLGYVLVIVSVLITLIVIAILRGTPFYDSFVDFPVFLIGIAIGMLAAGFSGVLLGIPVLRLRGDYLAIVTLGFGEIIRLFLNNLRDITGGPQGIVNIPHATVGNVEMGSNEGLLYLVIAGCLLVAFLSLRLKTSRLGRAWSALKSDEDIAQAMGVNLVNSKVLAFAIGATFAGIAGVIFAARQANIFPDNFTLSVSINVLSLVIIGGMGSVPGVVVGALVLIGVPESLRVFEAYRVLAFGALLVTMMLLRPTGLLPEPPQPLEQQAKLLANKEGASS